MKPRYVFLAMTVILVMSAGGTAHHPTGAAADKPGWTLIFSDEFDGTRLAADTWDTCYPWVEHTNCNLADSNELELYLSSEVYLDGSGHLMMRTQRQSMGGFDYLSGMVDTYYSFNFQYGYAEARVKLPAGQGLWPAFWLLPVNDGPWPDDEIDIMENLGNDPTTAYFSYHWPSGQGTSLAQYHYTGADFSAGWHTFAVDWEADAIIWYVDDVERARYSTPANITSKPMFVILNLAVGGDWPGSPNNTTTFPNYYQVDYVRVWQKTPANSQNIYLPNVRIGDNANGACRGR